MLDYRFTYVGRTDFDDLFAFREARQAGLGDDFSADVQALVLTLRTMPTVFAAVPACPRGRDIRHGQTDRFPTTVIYEVLPTEIVVLSVIHSRAHPRRWRRRLSNP